MLLWIELLALVESKVDDVVDISVDIDDGEDKFDETLGVDGKDGVTAGAIDNVVCGG